MFLVLFYARLGQMRLGVQRMYSSTTAPTTKLFLDGKLVESQATEWIDLHDPATNEVVTRIPKSTPAEMQAAVESSKVAYKVTVERSSCFFPRMQSNA